MPENVRMSFVNTLAGFNPVSLDEMDSVKLMNRIDSKYLTDEETLAGVLGDAAREGYRVLEIAGERISPYDSIYYDTEDLKMFLDHRNKKLCRQKVRTRLYVNSDDAYLEIKRKNNKGRTKKKRMHIPAGEFNDFRSDAAAAEYLAGHSEFTAEEISPVLETAFRRITLVNPAMTERLTIDTDLHFRNFRSSREASLERAVIIELKQDGRIASRMKGILLNHRVKPLRISKYCIAVTLTQPGARAGRFKEKVRCIEKIINKKIEII